MIAVIMRQDELTLQQAADYLGWLCMEQMARFEQARRDLPSWGPEIDRAVAGYAADVKGRRFPAEVETYFSKKPASP